MQYAVIKTGSKQYLVQEGDEIDIEKIEGKQDDDVSFSDVLLLVQDGMVEIGHPMLRAVKVSGKIVSQLKGEKIRVATYKAKSRYRRVKGHRQLLTRIKVTKIENSKSARSKPKTTKSSKKKTS